MAEFWDVYNAKRVKTSKIVERGKEWLKDGEYHLVVFGFVMDKNNNIFITQRDERKDYGLKWECSGGSVIKGEDTLLGVYREVLEESGLDIDKNLFKLIGTEKDDRDHVFVDIYLAILDIIDLSKVELQDGETVDAKIVSIEEFEKMKDEGMIAKNVQKCYDRFLKPYYEKNLKK